MALWWVRCPVVTGGMGWRHIDASEAAALVDAGRCVRLMTTMEALALRPIVVPDLDQIAELVEDAA